MPDSTLIYGWPFQEAGDPPDGATLGRDLAIGIEATVDGIDGRVGDLEAENIGNRLNLIELMLTTSRSAQDTAGVRPLVSSANTDTAVVSLGSFDFKGGYAYELTWSCRMQINGGSSPYAVHTKLKRASASGTVIHDPGDHAMIGANFMTSGVQGCIVRVTSDTTQTLVVTAAYATTGSPTSLDLESSASATAWVCARIIGTAAAHGAAPLLPTS